MSACKTELDKIFILQNMELMYPMVYGSMTNELEMQGDIQVSKLIFDYLCKNFITGLK